jgi:hypothetical protein
MRRKSLSMWAWSAYNPSTVLPEEVKFDLLDKNERSIGTLVYTKFKFFKEAELSTPWGPARLAFETLKGGLRIFLNEKELAMLDNHLSKGRAELTFSTGPKMVIVAEGGAKNNLELHDDRGSIGVFEEKGVLPKGIPGGRPQFTRDEAKMLPRDQRPKSIETREYRQFRLSTSGVLPVRLEDAVAAMMILVSYACLIEESPA